MIEIVVCITSVVLLCMQAMDYARKLRDDRGRGNIVVVDDGQETEEQMGEEEYQVTKTNICMKISR